MLVRSQDLGDVLKEVCKQKFTLAGEGEKAVYTHLRDVDGGHAVQLFNSSRTETARLEFRSLEKGPVSMLDPLSGETLKVPVGDDGCACIVLAPASVQEMADFVDLAFELAFKYRNPAMILSDGVIGQMMEKVVLPPYKRRRTDEEVIEQCPWASTGKTKDRVRNVITSLELKPEIMEQRNLHLQAKYAEIREKEVRYETQLMDDAEYMIVAFGSAARIAEKSVELARAEGIKVGLFRPITLWPFPTKEIANMAKGKKGVLVVEINAGQMVQDVRLAINGAEPVEHFGRLGGIVPDPEEIVNALKTKLM